MSLLSLSLGPLIYVATTGNMTLLSVQSVLVESKFSPIAEATLTYEKSWWQACCFAVKHLSLPDGRDHDTEACLDMYT
jgi:hypothetical protein